MVAYYLGRSFFSICKWTSGFLTRTPVSMCEFLYTTCSHTNTIFNKYKILNKKKQT